MKLRNKKTGDIGYLTALGVIKDDKIKWYETISDVNEEWEDYEEPKEHWYISNLGEVQKEGKSYINDIKPEKLEEIGNYFETKEEAEKAVEKLKAIKKLKDKGLSFKVKVIDRKWYLEPKAEPQHRTFDESHDLFKDVMLVFGGEE